MSKSPTREYQIISRPHADQLVVAVNKEMAAGWLPCGGVAVIGDPTTMNREYSQAMYRVK